MPAGFAAAGIDSAEARSEMRADVAYARLIASGTRPHFIGYYALVMGLRGRPWNDCEDAEKTALRARFNALVAGSRPIRPAIDTALDEIGVIVPKSRA